MTALRSLQALAALLLLANLALYLLWVAGDDGGAVRSDDAPPINPRGMALLGEIRPPQLAAPVTARAEPVESADGTDATAAAEKPEPAQAAAAPSDLRCYRIGPFARADDWAAAGSWMAAQGLDFRAVRSERRELRAIRVFVGPFESPAAAAPVVQQLRRAGIEQYPIAQVAARDGDGGGVLLSLGYFTQAARAARLEAELRARGFAVDSRDEYRSVGPFDWMEARLGPAARKRLLARDWGEFGAAASEFDCAAAADSGA